MAREFSGSFYKSRAWKNTREYIFKRDGGLCQDCLEKGRVTPGKEVHHIIHLEINNMNDTNITLGENNLRLLCKECHHKRHSNNKSIDDDLMFNEFGDLVER